MSAYVIIETENGAMGLYLASLNSASYDYGLGRYDNLVRVCEYSSLKFESNAEC